MSLDQAKELAAAQKKPILIDFTGVNCANCRLMEKRVLPQPEIVKLLGEFVTIQLYTDFVPIASITADSTQGAGREEPGAPARSGPGGDEPLLRGADPGRQAGLIAGRLQRAPRLS